MPLPKLETWFDAQVADQHTAHVLVGVQRFGLPSGPGQREHQLRVESFAQRVLADHIAQFGDQFLMLAKVDTPLWRRNPYLLEASTWGVVYVLHGAAALLTLTLTMAHVYFSLLPEKRAYLRAMIGGQMTREAAAEFHDPRRWSGQRKDDPRENGI